MTDAPALDDQPVVVFVGGMSRSGTTLLEEHLARRIDGAVVVGELRNIWRRGYLANDRCSCGREFSTCEFWSSVRSRALFDALDPEQAEQSRQLVDRFRVAVRPGAGRSSYHGRGVARLLAGIAKEVPGAVIIDSSKSPGHFRILRDLHLEGRISLYALGVTRDPRGVAYSMANPKQRPESQQASQMTTSGPIGSSVGWLLAEIGTSLVGRRLRGRFRRTKYESWVCNADELDRHVKRWGLVRAHELSRPHRHSVSGNPNRFSEDALDDVRLDTQWKAHLSVTDRAIVDLLCGLMLVRRGYRIP